MIRKDLASSTQPEVKEEPSRGSPPPAEEPVPVKLDGGAREQRRILAVLLAVVVLAGLYLTRAIAIPIVAAILVTLLFKPLVRKMELLRIGPGLSAVIIVSVVSILAAVAVTIVSGPIATWVEGVPAYVAQLEMRLQPLRRPVEEITAATERVEEATDVGGQSPLVVQIEPPNVAATVLNQTGATLFGLGLMLVLTFFLLASGDLFLRKVVRLMPTLGQKKDAVEAAWELEHDVSQYLVTVTLINTALALVLWGLLSLTGLHSAWLWGLVAGTFNFVPYIGPIVAFFLIAVTSVLQFETLQAATLPPLVFAICTALEGYLITPMIMSRRMSLNPVVILISLMFWGWMWGVPGALLAVPMLVCFKIVCEHVPALQGVGEFLSND